MDVFVGESPCASFLCSYDEVWRDRASWEICAHKHAGYWLCLAGESPQWLYFGALSGVGPAPVKAVEQVPPEYSGHSMWQASDYRHHLPGLDEGGKAAFEDFGGIGYPVLNREEDLCFEYFRLSHYRDHPQMRPSNYLPLETSPVVPNVPPVVMFGRSG